MIRGRYEPLGIVGVGGQGWVLRARDTLHDRQVAVKVRRVHPDEDRDALLSEARVLLSLAPHACVTTVREDFFDGDRYCIVMDWIEGTSLDEASPMSLDDAAPYLRQVAEALDHCHAHDVVHGDVKPSNVVITPDGRAVLVDFGVAGHAASPAASYGFRTPECATGPRTPATDVFGLAATACAVLTGAAPEAGAEPDWSGLPPHAARAIRRGLAYDPARRPPSAIAIVDSLVPPPVPSNLPASLTSFVGRETAQAQLTGLLSRTRLLTLAGLGGVGKTRLAIELASSLRRRFPDGVWLVELAPVSSPELVPAALVRAVDLREEPGRDPMITLAAAIGERRCLLVLDNCEHVIEAAARTAEGLLRSCPGLTVITTSREPLDVVGETAWPVPVLEPDPATALFDDRARAANPGFRIDPANAGDVTSVCRHLDGIPLAIEMAASLLRSMSLGELVSGLDDRFSRLVGGRTAPDRHATLKAAIDWSHDVLSGDERCVFRSVSVFAHAFAPEAAGQVCGDRLPGQAVHDALRALASRSLLVAEYADGGERYRMLETIREYARERLAESGEGPALRRRYLGWVSDLAQRCLPGVLGGRDQVEALDVLDSILDDVRSALEWGATNDEAEAALELATSMARFWVVRGHAREGRAWYERLLARPGISDDARSLALLNLGSICVEWFADLAAARLAFEESIALNRVLGRRNKVGLGLMNMGLIGVVRREPEEARPFLEEALAIARDIGDEALQCQALGNLGIVHRLAGDDDRARSHYEEATALFRARGDLRATAIGLSELARLAGDGDPASSAALFGEAIELFDKVGDRGSASLVRVNFAVDRCRAGDLEGAESVCVRALRDGLELEMLDLSAPVELLATIAVRRGDHLRAAALYGLRDAMRRTLGERAISEELDETPELIELTRSALGDVAFGAAWQDGSTLPPSAALEDDRIGAP